MSATFEWNNVSCTTYGIHVLTQPVLTRPLERLTYTDVPGRNGALVTTEGTDVYDDILLTIECYVADTSQISNINKWLKGSGTLKISTRLGGFYYARVNNQIEFEKVLRIREHRTFSIIFRCKPFWYATGTQDITITTSTTSVTNPGSVYSEPRITVYGSGEITLMVGQYITELTDVDESIVLDSELQEAYKGTDSKNSCVSGDFPLLVPGSNAISWTGEVTSVVVTPRWRYL